MGLIELLLNMQLLIEEILPQNFCYILRFLIFCKNISNDHMSGVQILVLVKRFVKLSSVAYGWKNNVYNGTPCSTETWSMPGWAALNIGTAINESLIRVVGKLLSFSVSTYFFLSIDFQSVLLWVCNSRYFPITKCF